MDVVDAGGPGVGRAAIRARQAARRRGLCHRFDPGYPGVILLIIAHNRVPLSVDEKRHVQLPGRVQRVEECDEFANALVAVCGR